MSTKLYVMIKGRTKGPFTIDKLRQLAEQNQLSKMHQVSDDQMTWIAAGDYENGLLWQQWEQEPEPEPEPETGPPPESQWYYTRNGAQLGPIGLSELKNFFGCGELKPDEQVWTDSMEHWKAAVDVPELAPYFKKDDLQIQESPTGTDEIEIMASATNTSSSSSQRRKKTSDTEVSLDICKIANGSRGWTIFIAVVAFIGATGAIVAGVIDLVQGIKRENSLLVVAGLIFLSNCAINITGGLLLLNFSNKMALLYHKKKEANLKQALISLNKFWLFVAIVLIVSIAAGAIGTLIIIIEAS